jgi:membrane protease YdiL (CAAX protease family)
LITTLFSSASSLWTASTRWVQAALQHAAAMERVRVLPVWLALTFVALDFLFLGLWFRWIGTAWSARWAVLCTTMFGVRLGLGSVGLWCTCRYYRCSAAALGCRPLHIFSDVRWALRMSVTGACVVGMVLVTALTLSVSLGGDLPAPSKMLVQILGGSWTARQLMVILMLGAAATLIAPLGEELIYRSLLVPALSRRLGLFLAIGVSSLLFGLAHVAPFGELWIPLPQIIGGVVMAAAFSIRWSVVPALTIHATGNFFVGIGCLAYVRLYEACPAWFGG